MNPDDIPRDPKRLSKFMDAIPMTPIEGSGGSTGELHATHHGVLRIGNIELKVYQLSNGVRVFDADDIERFFGVLGGDAS